MDMNRYVFAALAVVAGIAVQSLPQNRFQTYQVSYTAGKPADEGSVRVGDAAPADPIIPDSESASTEPVQSLPTPEASQVNEFQNMWKQAAKNLITIPHLLQWVSSLHSSSLMNSIIPKKALVEEPAEATEQPNANVNVQEPEVITDTYEKEVITEPAITDEQIASDPEIPFSQHEPIEPIEQQPIEDVLTIEPEVTVQPEQVVIVEEQIIEEPIAIKEIAAANSIPVEPENLENVDIMPVQDESVNQPEPVQEAVTDEPEVASALPEAIEEITLVQAEPIKVLSETPEPTETVIAEPQPEVFGQKEIMHEPQSETIQKNNDWENQFVPKINPQFQKPVVESKKAIPVSKIKYNKFSSRKQSAKKGKTLFSFAPEPQPNPFALDAFAFPSYSYSISHQPSPTYYRRL